MSRLSMLAVVVVAAVLLSVVAPATKTVSGATARAQPALALASASAETLTLKDGTAVPLKFARAISSSDVIAGETVNLYAADDVRVDGALVIPKYSPARATVMLARPRQKIGISGRLQLRFDSVRLADGQVVPLRLIQSLEVDPNNDVGFSRLR